ncbi:hypothetical protein GCM10017788_32980 [Amycolatopsis acidiphila]|nr:hypothetical protein GCM10017788_32980 [Amycolatopsis acidiphila]
MKDMRPSPFRADHVPTTCRDRGPHSHSSAPGPVTRTKDADSPIGGSVPVGVAPHFPFDVKQIRVFEHTIR